MEITCNILVGAGGTVMGNRVQVVLSVDTVTPYMLSSHKINVSED